MTEKLEKEIIRGIIEAATKTGLEIHFFLSSYVYYVFSDAWILTMGANNGVSKLIGEGISHYRLLREYSDKVKCIGLIMLEVLDESTRSELRHPTLVNKLTVFGS